MWKQFVGTAALACATVLTAAVAQAQAPAWPAKPVRIMVPSPAGLGPDVLCRQVAQKLGERLGQPFTLDNRPGVSGHIAAEATAKAPADGYTILCGPSSTFVTTPHILPKLNYDPTRDVVPVVMLARAQMLLVAHPSVPADDLPGLIAWLKANPGTASYATPGIGSSNHLVMELFKSRVGVDLQHVPYNNQPAITDVAGGRVNLMVESSAVVAPFIRDGRIKPIAVVSPNPMPEYPKVAPARQTVPDFEMMGWAAFYAPAGTPRAVMDRLATEVAAIVQLPDVRNAFAPLGFVPDGAGPEPTRRSVQAEYERWGAVVKAANIKAQQ